MDTSTGSPANRLEKVRDGFRKVEFDVYGPKALAAIASLPEALASRCIRIIMFRAAADSPIPRRRLDDDSVKWADHRDDLHALALAHGATWLALANRSDVCPKTMGGRDYELWQPLLALASWLEDAGAIGLLAVVQEHAEQTIEAVRDDSVNEADETLLRLLAEHILNGTHRTLRAKQLLYQARDSDSVTFGRWSPKGVGNALACYGLRTHKGTGNTGLTYSRVTLSELQRVETTYGFELNLPS